LLAFLDITGMRHEHMLAWTPEEDIQILRLFQTEGRRWGKIAQLLQGRSAASVRNRYLRIEKGSRLREAGMSKNRCAICGQHKLGHVCPGKTSAVPFVIEKIAHPMTFGPTAEPRALEAFTEPSSHKLLSLKLVKHKPHAENIGENIPAADIVQAAQSVAFGPTAELRACEPSTERSGDKLLSLKLVKHNPHAENIGENPPAADIVDEHLPRHMPSGACPSPPSSPSGSLAPRPLPLPPPTLSTPPPSPAHPPPQYFSAPQAHEARLLSSSIPVG